MEKEELRKMLSTFTEEEFEKEEWRDCVGYEGSYQVSSLGRVRSLDRELVKSKGGIVYLKGQLLKLNVYKKERYLYVCFGKKKLKVHRLVCLAFVPNPENKPTVNHKDEIRDNNRLSNLEWMTIEEQNKYSRGINTKIFHDGVIKSYPSVLEAANDLGIVSSVIVTLSDEYYQLMKICTNMLVHNTFVYKPYVEVSSLKECKGIIFKGGKYNVRVTVSLKKRVYIGDFDTLNEAIERRNDYVVLNSLNSPLFNVKDSKVKIKDDIMSGLHILNSFENVDDIQKKCIENLIVKFKDFIS